jgi:hypothetical protein
LESRTNPRNARDSWLSGLDADEDSSDDINLHPGL